MRSNGSATLLYDGVYTFGMRIVNAIAAAALGILTARILGPAGKGIYTLPMVEAGLVGTAFTGLTSATSYFMLNANAGRTILRTALATMAVGVVLGAAVVTGFAYAGHALWAAAAAIASLPATAATCIVAGYAVGIRRVRGTTTVTVATTLVNLVLVGVGFAVFARSPWIAIAAWVAALNLVAAIGLVVVFAHSRTLRDNVPVRTGDFVRFATKAGATNLVTLLNYRGDLYIVALLTSVASLGLYSVAVSASETLLIATQSAAITISPHVGSMDRRAAAQLTARCVRNNLLVAAALCGILFVAAPWVVALLYGGRFLPLVPVLRILLVGVVAVSLGSPVSSYFTLKLGRPEISLWIAGLSAAVCIALAAVLVPMLGIVGAAIGSTAAYIAGQAVGMSVFSRQARIGLRALLLPTVDDAAFYVRSARRIVSDGRRLLFGGSA